MSLRPVRTLMAAGLLAGVLVACQAPGFMGLNGETSIPGLGMEAYTLARVPIRVVLPADLTPGRKAGDRLELPAEGAKVYLALDPTNTARTDSEGIAPLTIPVNGVQLIHAEIRTASGTMLLQGLMGLPFSRERERASGPNTVALPSMRELNEPLTLSLSSTLVAAHLQERFTPEQIRYLDPGLLLSATREVSQVLKTDGGGFRTASLPDLTDGEDVARVARDLVNRHEKLRTAFAQVFATRIPDFPATPSATASALPVATASIEASASAPVLMGGPELFPLTNGTSVAFTLLDTDEKPVGQLVRSLIKVVEKSDGVTATGRLTVSVDGATRQLRFLMKRQAHQLKLSMPYRPELTYPLPFVDAAEWSPAPGLTAKAIHTPGSDDEPDFWTVTVAGDLKGQAVEWVEIYQADAGLIAFTWGNSPDAPMARILPVAD